MVTIPLLKNSFGRLALPLAVGLIVFVALFLGACTNNQEEPAAGAPQPAATLAGASVNSQSTQTTQSGQLSPASPASPECDGCPIQARIPARPVHQPGLPSLRLLPLPARPSRW